jgi:hypothetical protein
VTACLITINNDVVHDYLQVREGGHESLGHTSDGITTNSRGISMDAERAVQRVEASYSRGVLATPRCGVTLCKTP